MKALDDLFDAVSKAEAGGTRVDRIELGSFFWMILRAQEMQADERRLREQSQRDEEMRRWVPEWKGTGELPQGWPDRIPEGSLLFGIPVRQRDDLSEGFRLWSAKRPLITLL